LFCWAETNKFIVFFQQYNTNGCPLHKIKEEKGLSAAPCVRDMFKFRWKREARITLYCTQITRPGWLARCYYVGICWTLRQRF